MRKRVTTDTIILLLIALTKLLLHTLTNNQYGFHRDELATVDDAHYLAWGYVAYPPFTPFIARVALELFGPSLRGLRFFAALGGAIATVLAGLIARELGGKRLAQMVAAVSVAIAPLSLASSRVFQYVAFDYLWWVLLAYLVVRLLNSDDPRWWPAIGVVIGLGMMTKFTMIFLVAGVAVGILLTRMRYHLRSPWLWLGAAVSLIVFAPNFVWQVQNNFISVEFLNSIHARDIRIGRTDGFLISQLFTGAGLLTVPLAIAGLIWLFRWKARPYSVLGWMFVIPLVLFILVKGRNYYQAPAYPMILAAGSVWLEQSFAMLTARRSSIARFVTWAALAANAILGIIFLLPIARVRSPLWNAADKVSDDFREEIGWPELVETVSGIRNSLPAEDQAHFGILAGNYGEAGAIDLYGASYGLPKAISGINSYWLRGFGGSPPQTVIVVGLSESFLKGSAQKAGAFESCAVAGHLSNREMVLNEETERHSDVFVCRHLLKAWPDFWKDFRYFG
jgi:4-amino-4-deoxy-L-arabinose transferase-like glycosyltransferase